MSDRQDLPPEARIAALEKIAEMLFARIYELEGSNIELREALGLDLPEPAEEAVTTIKGAAHLTGLSLSAVRKQIAAGKTAARPVGGRWLVRVASLSKRRPA